MMRCFALLFIVACALAIRPAQATRLVCGAWADMRPALAGKFHEIPVGAGVAGSGKSRVEIHASRDGKTFSVFVIYPEGMACMIASGVDWETLPAPAAPAAEGERES